MLTEKILSAYMIFVIIQILDPGILHAGTLVLVYNRQKQSHVKHNPTTGFGFFIMFELAQHQYHLYK